MKQIFYIIGILFFFSSCSSFRPLSTGKIEQTQAESIKYPELNADISPTAGAKAKKIKATETAAPVESIESWRFKYAILMNLPVEDLTNTKLYSFIDEWYGTPYRYGGNTKKGIDCSAFTLFLFADVYNARLPRTSAEQFVTCEKISRVNLEEGDLVFFKERSRINHVGVYLGYNKFAHASSSRGVMISDLDELYFSRRFVGGGRLKQQDWVEGGR